MARTLSMLRFRRPALGLLTLLTLWPSMVFGQAQRAGVVTILEGQATVKRVALPAPVPLKFKDDVFVQDRVETGEKSLVRLLLGGAALVTIRARSIATITEIPGKSTINLDSGKISLAVARDRLRPGDSLEIRTVNAVAAIRGTVVVAEINRASPDASGNASLAVTTSFHVLRGTITAHNFDPATGAPLTAPQAVAGGQSFTAAGTAAPTIGPNPPVAVVTAGLTPGRPQHSQAANGAELSAQAVETARLLVQSLIGTVPGDSALPSQGPVALALPPTPETLIQPEAVTLQSLPKLLPGGGNFASASAPASTAGMPGATTPPAPPGPPAGGPPPPPPATTFSPLPGLLASTAMSAFLQPPPAPVIVLSPSGQIVQIDGAAIEVPSGGTLTLDRSLLAIIDTIVNTGSLLSVPGTLASATTDILVFVDPSVVNTTGDLIGVAGVLSLAGSLFVDIAGTFNVGGNFLTVTGQLTSTSPDALLGFVGSSVHAGVPASGATAPARLVDLVGPTAMLSIAGPLIEAVDSVLVTTDEAIRILGGGTLAQNGTTEPLLRLTGGSLDSGTHLLKVSGSSAGGSVATHLTLSGPLLEASNASVNAGANLVELDGRTTLTTGTAPLISSSGSSIDVGAGGFGGALLLLCCPDGNGHAPSAVLNGPFLSASDSTVVARGTAVRVVQGAHLGVGPAGLVDLTDSSLSVVGGHLFGLSSGGTLETSGELLKAERGQVTVASDLLNVDGGAALVTSAPLVRATDTTLVIGGRLLAAEGDLAVLRTATSPPLGNTPLLALDFSGGGHLTVGTIATPHAIVARGVTTQQHVDPDFGTIPSLGTDRPIVHQGGGPMLQVTAARTDTTAASFDVEVTGSALHVDTALLQATAPLLGLTQAAMRTSGSTVDIFQKARVEAGQLVRLDRSRLDVASGDLVRVSGGSLLRAQNLLTVANGSRVNIQNGALLNVMGNSFVNIAGCLVCFTGANNVVTVTNAIAPTGFLFGVVPIAGTVQVGAGATAASVFPGLGANSNQLVVNGVLVNVGPGSTLKIQ